MLETLDYTIRIGSTPTFYISISTYAAHYVYLLIKHSFLLSFLYELLQPRICLR